MPGEFRYFNGITEVLVRSETIIERMIKLFEELYFLARINSDKQELQDTTLDGFADIFRVERLKTTTTYWTGENDDQTKPQIGLSDAAVLAIVERFLVEYENELRISVMASIVQLEAKMQVVGQQIHEENRLKEEEAKSRWVELGKEYKWSITKLMKGIYGPPNQ